MPDKVLIVGPSWIGDMVMAQALFIHLKHTRPGVQIDVLAPAWSDPLLARMPEVSAPLNIPIGHGELALGRRRKLGQQLRVSNYDQAIILPNSFKSALIPFVARIPKRTGWRGEYRYGLLNDMRDLDPHVLPLMVQRFVALGQEGTAELPAVLPKPSLLVDAGVAKWVLEKFAMALDLPMLSLCPGAEFGSAKRWPAAYFAELANEYLAQGWQVALFGSAKDRAVAEEIISACGGHEHCFNLAGKTSLGEAVDLLSQSNAVVSNDSGLMHIAAALDRPTLVIYGATSPGFTPPLTERAAIELSDIDCAPCFQRECPLQHHRCMRDTLPAQVADKLAALLIASDKESGNF